MPGQISSSNDDPVFIPAWKRLGLKLKNTDTNSSPSSDSPNIPVAKKRKVNGDSLSVKAKPGKVPEPKSPPRLASSSPLHQSPSKSTVAKQTKKKRASVKFTSDSKTEDGTSLKDLHKDWLEEEQQRDPSFSSDAVPEALQVRESSSTSDSRKSPKRVKVKKSSKEKSEPTTVKPTHPALDYLLQFQNDRQNWKFNKANQNYILKHCFDVERIPEEYNLPLLIYIRNLQSEMAAQRLIDGVKVLRKADEEPWEEPEHLKGETAYQQQCYQEAMAKWIAQSLELEGKLIDAESAAEAMKGELPIDEQGKLPDEEKGRAKKRRRAESVMAMLHNSDEKKDGNSSPSAKATSPQTPKVTEKPKKSGKSSTKKAAGPKDATKKKPARKRKRRTMDVDGNDSESNASTVQES